MDDYLFVYVVQLEEDNIPRYKNEIVSAYSQKEAYHKFITNPYWSKWTHSILNIIKL